MTWETIRKTNWPDPGLSRNTRCRCYRCSVPGLAGFTRLALCGARDLINLNLCLTMREHSQQSVNGEM